MEVCWSKVGRIFGSFDSVLTLAFSGVAASNLGDGASTIDSVFHTNSDNAKEDLSGDALDRLLEKLRHVKLLVLDEISTVGAAQFEIISRRLDQVGKALWRERTGQAPPDDLQGFGGIAVVCMGDFAQLPPVLSTLLLAGGRLQDAGNSGLRTVALSGQRRFQNFVNVIRLRRIHRLKGADPYKESTMRLRDAAITLEDYALWKQHEIDDDENSHVGDAASSSGATWSGAGSLLSEGLWLVAENSQAGSINGQRLASTVPRLGQPTLGSCSSIVVRCEARHNNPRAENRKAADFRNIRKACHLRVGARVILTVNAIWDVQTVPLGLMNGARGIVVAILFASVGSQRTDGNEMAGVGVPTLPDGQMLPRGMDQCPLPDFVVVHFPGYTGPCLLTGLPQTWVPVPCCEVMSKTSKFLRRVAGHHRTGRNYKG